MRLAIALLTVAASLCGQAGHWEGVLKQENRDTLFTIDLDNRPDWNGTFLIPGQKAPPLPLAGLVIQPPSVQFEVRDLPGTPTFKGLLGENGQSIRGTVTQGGGVVAFEMRRTGDAHVESIPANTPLDSPFLGDWTGTVAQATPVRVIVHLRDDAQGLGSGTLDTADHRARNLVLSGIVQTGARLSFAVRLLGATFTGERNPDGGRIEGSWTQNGTSLPFTLKRRE